MTGQLLTVDQVAELVQLGPESVRVAIRRGDLKACRPTGGARGPLRVRPEDYAAWVAAGEVAATPDVEPLLSSSLPKTRSANTVTNMMRQQRRAA